MRHVVYFCSECKAVGSELIEVPATAVSGIHLIPAGNIVYNVHEVHPRPVFSLVLEFNEVYNSLDYIYRYIIASYEIFKILGCDYD